MNRTFFISSVLLVVANLIVLVGVVFWGWSLAQVLITYWLEGLIMGLLAVMQIALAQEAEFKPDPDSKYPESFTKRATIQQFSVFFFLFMGMSGWLLYLFFLDSSSGFASENHIRPGDLRELIPVVIVFTLGHIVSLVVTYVSKNLFFDSRQAFPGQALKRMITLHVSLILGAILLFMTGGQQIFVVLFVVIKTYYDFLGSIQTDSEKEAGNELV